MRIGKELDMSTIFTAWGYEVTYLELVSVIASLIAVTLGALGRRIAWPWWIVSSSLYGAFFYAVDLYASAILQLIFIAAALWGWFGWKPTGVEPRYLSNRERLVAIIALVAIWVTTAPLLSKIGAAATWTDSFLLVSSAVAQVLMVLQRNESWFLWFVINLFGTWHYARQDFWFTSLLYVVLTGLAVFGWIRWLRIKR